MQHVTPGSITSGSSSAAGLEDAYGAFARALHDRGLHGALGYLNARTRHRFTGLYRVEPPRLRSVSLYDRENPGIRAGEDAPLADTYCGLACASRAPFRTDDARRDPRLAGHAAREAVLAYCGVPVFDAAGAVAGTLCHFDSRPRLAPAAEKELLARAAVLLAAYLHAAPTAA